MTTAVALRRHGSQSRHRRRVIRSEPVKHQRNQLVVGYVGAEVAIGAVDPLLDLGQELARPQTPASSPTPPPHLGGQTLGPRPRGLTRGIEEYLETVYVGIGDPYTGQ